MKFNVLDKFTEFKAKLENQLGKHINKFTKLPKLSW